MASDGAGSSQRTVPTCGLMSPIELETLNRDTCAAITARALSLLHFPCVAHLLYSLVYPVLLTSAPQANLWSAFCFTQPFTQPFHTAVDCELVLVQLLHRSVPCLLFSCLHRSKQTHEQTYSVH